MNEYIYKRSVDRGSIPPLMALSTPPPRSLMAVETLTVEKKFLKKLFFLSGTPPLWQILFEFFFLLSFM